MINNQPNVPHSEEVKAKNEKRRTRAYIRARPTDSFTGGKHKTAAARGADKSRDKMHVFVDSRLSRWDLAERFTPMSPTRACLSCAHSYAAPKKGLQPSSRGTTGRAEAARSRGRDTNAATGTGMSLQEAHCAEEESTNDRKRRKAGGGRGNKKNPSQHEVVRDWRRVTDGIRTHDIQNHNLTL